MYLSSWYLHTHAEEMPFRFYFPVILDNIIIPQKNIDTWQKPLKRRLCIALKYCVIWTSYEVTDYKHRLMSQINSDLLPQQDAFVNYQPKSHFVFPSSNGLVFWLWVFFFFVYKICNSLIQCLKYKNCKNQQGADLKLKSQKLLPHTLDVSHGFQGSTKETQVDFLPNSPKGKTLVCSKSQKASMKFGTCNVKGFFFPDHLYITEQDCKRFLATLAIQVVALHFTLLTMSPP